MNRNCDLLTMIDVDREAGKLAAKMLAKNITKDGGPMSMAISRQRRVYRSRVPTPLPISWPTMNFMEYMMHHHMQEDLKREEREQERMER